MEWSFFLSDILIKSRRKKIIGMFRARQRKIVMRALFVVIIQILWQLKKLKTGQYPLHTLFIGVAVIFWQ